MLRLSFFVVPSYKFYEAPPMLRYQFIGQSEEKIERGPDATTGSLSYDRGQILKALRCYDGGLAESLYNARRRTFEALLRCRDTPVVIGS